LVVLSNFPGSIDFCSRISKPGELVQVRLSRGVSSVSVAVG
jgi:hypothetical protein